jgi:serine/threonine protein kinase
MSVETNLKKLIIFQTTFSTYTASAIIGEGGAGRIYRAVDDSGDKWAVKGLDPVKATKEKVKRFKNELRFCSKNQHKNIVTVFDHGVFVEGEKKAPFYVMPLYDGSLRDLLQKGIASDKAMTYYAQILDGVEAAHLQGVVHRDLKPENVLHDAANDRLLIADFGIARFEEDELYTAVETKDSQRLANFQYAAPEQRSRGGELEVDQRADIYALGLMLNEMFTGEVPLGTGYKTIAQAAVQHQYLDGLVSAMLRQSPLERPSSIEEIKQQLIGRKNEFVTSQRLSQLKETVVPVGEVDDLLIADPIKLVDFDWENDRLTLSLSHPVNETWIWALRNMGSFSSLLGKGPEYFSFAGDRAIIGARENEVQRTIDYFKDWLPKANRVYEERIRRDLKAEEEKRRRQLQRQIEEQEARQRVLKNIKL